MYEPAFQIDALWLSMQVRYHFFLDGLPGKGPEHCRTSCAISILLCHVLPRIQSVLMAAGDETDAKVRDERKIPVFVFPGRIGQLIGRPSLVKRRMVTCIIGQLNIEEYPACKDFEDFLKGGNLFAMKCVREVRTRVQLSQVSQR
jgi:hypothetical protein